MHSDLMTASY